MTSIAPQQSRASTPSPVVAPALSMPPPPSIQAQQIQHEIASRPSQRHDYEGMTMPPASISRHSGGEHSYEGSGLTGPLQGVPPLQLSFWESRNGPLNQIMMHLGNAIITLLKLFTPKKGI